MELRRRGRRARDGSVAVTYLPAPVAEAGDPPRIAFAVPRRTGSAVVRNRLRRRARGHLVARRRHPEALPAGAYLVALGEGSACLEPEALRDALDRCLDRVTAAAPGAAR